ncbi:YncE family protein [Micromonospora sp. CA-244673]|uniref:YncE family protein n=1 Tax=Micromonospora sp. CA-244673 TaxID=3239958 RepID=UPI003D8FE310
MRRLSVSIAAGALGLGLLATGQPAVAATSYDQPLVTVNSTLVNVGFSDMVKSAATGRILISSGKDYDALQVADLDGGIVGTVPGQAGASGLTLNKDGRTAYAALFDAGAISAIDVATGTETARYVVGADTCPYDLALAGGKLWFSYGCYGISPARLGSVDLGDPAAPMTLDQGGYLTFTPRLESGSIDDGLLFAMVEGVYPNRLISYDVSGGTAVRRTALEDTLQSVSEFAVTPDGSAVIVATPGEYQFTTKLARYSATDLTEQGRYAVPGSVVSLGVEPDGRMATYSDDLGLAYFAPGEYEPRWMVYQDFAPGLEPAHRGIALGDQNRLYVATRYISNSTMNLTAVDAVQPPVEVTPLETSLSVDAPASVAVRKPATFTGRLATLGDTEVGVQTVHVTREDKRGAVALPDVQTAADGSFTVTDVPRVAGETSWRFVFDGTEQLYGSRYLVQLRAR